MELFKLFGTIAIKNNEAVNALDEVIEQGEKTQSKLANSFEKIGSAAAKVGKVVAAGVGTAATAIGTITTLAVKNYADYEQLVGGSQLLFGEAYDFVAEKAKNAYKDVQMSQNEYLQQMNGFATGLKTALGGNEQAAAELASKIITAEADIVAATGNSQEAVQNAFNGIMKSNFTMLDNLQLGITPTKEGFQEVIDKVNEWNKANGEATAYQIENLADCQAALVDYVKMQGLAGYAANEAAGTISGSIATMKSAWQNLLVGFADSSQDMDALVSNMFDSVVTVGRNLVPRIQETLQVVWGVVKKNAPKILAEIPKMVMELLPQSVKDIMTEAHDYLCDTVVFGLEAVWESIKKLAGAFKPLVDAVKSFLAPLKDANEQQRINVEIVYFLEEALYKVADVINKVADVLTKVFNFIAEHKKLVESVVIVIGSFAAAFVVVINTVKTLTTIIKGVSAAITLLTSPIGIAIVAIGALVAAGVLLYKNWDEIKAKAVELFDNIKTTFENIKFAVSEITNTIWSNMVSTWDNIRISISSKISSIVSTVSGKFEEVKSSITNKINGAKDAVHDAIEKIKGFFNFQFKWPHIPLPHFSISPSGWKVGDLLDGIVPSLGIEWYAKGGVLEEPTAFGINGNRLMVGGEAGPEAVAPIDVLQNYIAEAVAAQNSGLIDILQKILAAILSNNEEMKDKFIEALEEMRFDINNREFARLVKAVN